jgi:hypothetical protein
MMLANWALRQAFGERGHRTRVAAPLEEEKRVQWGAVRLLGVC